MKVLKETLRTLVSASLFWLGTGGAVASLLTYYLLWSGYLDPVARLVDVFHAGLYVAPFFMCVFFGSVCLAIIGIIVGIVRLFFKLRGPAQGAVL